MLKKIEGLFRRESQGPQYTPQEMIESAARAKKKGASGAEQTGLLLTNTRRTQGLGPEEAARQLGISKAKLLDIESGGMFPSEIAQRAGMIEQVYGLEEGWVGRKLFEESQRH